MSRKKNRWRTCLLCRTKATDHTRHHLVPRALKGHTEFGRLHSDRWYAFVYLCWGCHTMVHRTYSNEELARSYYTPKKLSDAFSVNGQPSGQPNGTSGPNRALRGRKDE